MGKNNGNEKKEEKENERISRIWTDDVSFGEHNWEEISNIFGISIHQFGSGRLNWVNNRNRMVTIGRKEATSKRLPYYIRNLYRVGIEKINLLETGNPIPIIGKRFKKVKNVIKASQELCDGFYETEGISRQDKIMAEKASVIFELTLDVNETKLHNSRLLKPIKSYLLLLPPQKQNEV